jgi:hypothetical protein
VLGAECWVLGAGLMRGFMKIQRVLARVLGEVLAEPRLAPSPRPPRPAARRRGSTTSETRLRCAK